MHLYSYLQRRLSVLLQKHACGNSQEQVFTCLGD